MVDLNDASLIELQKLPGIGLKLARQIVEHRPYKSVDELQRVPGIGKKTIDRLRSRVRIETLRR